MSRTNKRVAGRTHDQIDREWRAKYESLLDAREQLEMPEIHRRWRSMGKLVSHGAAVRIQDGWNIRRYR